MAQEPTEEAKVQKPKYDWTDFGMLFIIMASLTGMFLGGIGIIVGVTTFEAQDVVAILAPPLGVVSTVAAGVFGYSLGTRGTTEAQRTASAAAQEATAVRQEAAATAEAAAPLARATRRIAGQAIAGAPTPTGKRDVSEDDLNTLRDAAEALAAKLGPRV